MKGNFNRLIVKTALILCAANIFYPIAAAVAEKALPFDDISTSYAKNEIIDLYNKKILAGTSPSSFSPARSITRAEFIAVLNRLLKLEPVETPINAYADVKQSAWYYGWVQAAVQLELAAGKSAAAFAPEKPVTRQEAAVWIARALKQAGNTPIGSTVFGDGSLIADWASAAAASVYKLGLMKGDNKGNFRPAEPITREETAVLIDRVLQKDKWVKELDKKPDKKITIGWQYGQTTGQYIENLSMSNVNTLTPRWYFIEKTGAVLDQTDPELIAWAKKSDKQIWAMVGNRSDQALTHQILTNSAASNHLIDQLAELVSRYGLDGLNIDFENVAPKDGPALTAFVTQLAERLDALKAVLSVDVSPDLGTDWTEAFDYAALGKQADYIVMMGYDEHYGGSPKAGPNASLPYVKHAIEKLLKTVSNAKVILALPFYNRDWTLKPDGAALSSAYLTIAEQNALVRAYSLKPVWDAELAQYVVSYTKFAAGHRIWLEEGRSLAAKYKLVEDKSLAGTAYWYIGGESEEIWAGLRNAEKFYRYNF
ncbi:S-layer homology domain-containing protein [Paenibacillus sp. IITD108]|uniref:S-layer homology domain-containing protein n=1 Tax=Paenibacillus sp. IITD108 TaxID=3116649 RepID=UPI002F41C586